MRYWFAALLILLPFSTSAQQAESVDLAIVVSLDRSESIDAADALTQINGLIYTLRHSRFRHSVASGPFGRIALAVATWSSFGRHEVILPWMQIAGPADAARAAAILEQDYTRQRVARHGSQTDVAFAIEVGMGLFDTLPWQAEQRVINVVADGISNIGRVATVDRDAALERGISINGLIMAQGSAIEVMSRYFRSEVIGGPTAFLQVSSSNEEFALAMLRKMLLEMVRLREPEATAWARRGGAPVEAVGIGDELGTRLGDQAKACRKAWLASAWDCAARPPGSPNLVYWGVDRGRG